MVDKQRESGYTLAQEIALGEAQCENMSKRNTFYARICSHLPFIITLIP